MEGFLFDKNALEDQFSTRAFNCRLALRISLRTATVMFFL